MNPQIITMFGQNRCPSECTASFSTAPQTLLVSRKVDLVNIEGSPLGECAQVKDLYLHATEIWMENTDY